jgi:nucleotide-binding universal stress UspA family protein
MGEAIVVGTDGSATAKLAVEEAVRLAKALGAEVHLVSAFEPQRGVKISGAAEGAARVWQPLPDAKVESTLAEASASVRFAGVEVKTHTRQQEPADALLDVADEVSAKMIVVGNRGMHGVRRHVLGSVPNTVSHKARCNVLIVSTDGQAPAAA